MDEFILTVIKEESINDFEPGEMIGSGTSGSVLKSLWKSKNLMVAVKNIHVKNIQKEVSVVKMHSCMLHPLYGLLLFQVAIIKSLRHKNVVHFYGFYQDPEKFFHIILGLFFTPFIFNFKKIV